VSDRDEDHREPRGTFEDYLREQRAANECPTCGKWSHTKQGGRYVFVCCDDEEATADV
jgi:hypothetical protein